MIGIIDYGVGNLFSLKSSLAYIGEEAVVTGDEKKLKQCEKILLPGVGAFRDAAWKLRQSGLADVVLEEAAAGKPLLGIWRREKSAAYWLERAAFSQRSDQMPDFCKHIGE